MTQDSITVSVFYAVIWFECVAWLQRFTGDYEISAVAYVLCMCVCQGGVLSFSSKVAPLGYRVLTFDF